MHDGKQRRAFLRLNEVTQTASGEDEDDEGAQLLVTAMFLVVASDGSCGAKLSVGGDDKM